MGSANPKTVYTAGVLLFNHMLKYERDPNNLKVFLSNALKTIIELLPSMTDKEAIHAVVLSEIRMLFKN